MITRQLGAGGPHVAALGLGLMGMSEFYGPTDDAQSIATIHHAIARGVNFFDTADTYGNGHNEELLGRAIRQWDGDREQLVIATKFGIQRAAGCYERTINGRPEYAREACENSLKRLGLETIDLYYQHRMDPNVPTEDTVGAMAELVRVGKIRHIGLSEASAATIRRAHQIHPIAAVQTEYSLWTRDVEAEILPLCQELGIALVAYSPLGRGFLTGSITNTDSLDDKDFRRIAPRFQKENMEINLKLVEHLREMAADRQTTPARIAIAWLLAKGDNIIPIFGTRKIERLEENLDALNLTLSAAEQTTLSHWFNPEHIAGERYPEAGMKGVNI